MPTDPNAPSASRALIRALEPGDRASIARHLLALEAQDRYLRFGYAASDEQVGRYVERLDFVRGEVFGIFDRQLELLAMAHLAYSVQPECTNCAEFGVSVNKQARGRGYGMQLFGRAVMHARNHGVSLLFIHALSENAAMLAIARKAGAAIERDGPESRAYLRLPPADFESQASEMLAEQVARANYQIKAQARRFWRFLQGLQDLRWGSSRGRSNDEA